MNGIEKQQTLHHVQHLIGVSKITENIINIELLDQLTSFEEHGKILQIDFNRYYSLDNIKKGFDLVTDTIETEYFPYKIEFLLFRTNTNYKVKTLFIDIINKN